MAYEKQTWQTGDVITQEKLNHMEDGIADRGGGGDVLIVAFTNDDQTDPNGTWSCDTENAVIGNALQNGNPVIGIATFTMGGTVQFRDTVLVSFSSGTYYAAPFPNGGQLSSGNLSATWNVDWQA